MSPPCRRPVLSPLRAHYTTRGGVQALILQSHALALQPHQKLHLGALRWPIPSPQVQAGQERPVKHAPDPLPSSPVPPPPARCGTSTVALRCVTRRVGRASAACWSRSTRCANTSAKRKRSTRAQAQRWGTGATLGRQLWAGQGGSGWAVAGRSRLAPGWACVHSRGWSRVHLAHTTPVCGWPQAPRLAARLVALS